MKQINLGDKESFTKTITETDVCLFAAISGDFNPVHVNEEYARRTPFKGRIAHAPVATSLVAPILGQKLPGLGTIAVESRTRYLAPVRLGDTITATVEVIAKDESKNLVTLATVFRNQNGTVVADGEVTVMPPLEKFRDLVRDL